jgi:hypothetical protein
MADHSHKLFMGMSVTPEAPTAFFSFEKQDPRSFLKTFVIRCSLLLGM